MCGGQPDNKCDSFRIVEQCESILLIVKANAKCSDHSSYETIAILCSTAFVVHALSVCMNRQ